MKDRYTRNMADGGEWALMNIVGYVLSTEEMLTVQIDLILL